VHRCDLVLLMLINLFFTTPLYYLGSLDGSRGRCECAIAAGQPPPGSVKSTGRPRSWISRPASRSSTVASAGDRRSVGDAGEADTQIWRPDALPRSTQRQTATASICKLLGLIIIVLMGINRCNNDVRIV
jgi:hypothetical protein